MRKTMEIRGRMPGQSSDVSFTGNVKPPIGVSPKGKAWVFGAHTSGSNPDALVNNIQNKQTMECMFSKKAFTGLRFTVCEKNLFAMWRNR